MRFSKQFLVFKKIGILGLLLCTLQSYSQNIKGKVLDVATSEPLVGATISLEGNGTPKKELVKLDGTFLFKNLTAGKYSVKVDYVGYASVQPYTVLVGSGQVKPITILMKETSTSLNEVTVSADTYGSNDKTARRLERTAEPVMNILSSKTIQLLPDITVANALQRVSGVTIERGNSGQGRYPIIRGMEKRYINTLVNGIKIPSPDNKNRYVPLDLFPTELLERLEVSKSLTPSMEGDAIGGSINLVMKDAPNHLLVQANVAGGYNTTFLDTRFDKFDKNTIQKSSPNDIKGDNNYVATPADFSTKHLDYTNRNAPTSSSFGLTVGNRFGANKQYGFIVSGSMQNIFSGNNSTFFLPNAQPGLNNIPVFVELQSRRYSIQNKRTGLNAKFDYRINPNNKISLINTYIRLDDFQSRINSDTIALNSLVDVFSRSTWQYQSIYNSTLQGEHKISPTSAIDWSLVYSKANNHIPDQAQFSHEYPVATGSPDILVGLTHVWQHNQDRDYSAYVNFTKNVKLSGRDLEIKFGGLERNKTRDNFYNTYSLKPQLSSGSTIQNYTDINSAVWVFNPVSSGAPVLNGNNYTFTENVAAGYVQGKWQLNKKLEVLGGVRTEFTNQNYTTELGPEVDARSGKITYTDVLPSIQFKYAVNSMQSVRLSYYKALARPGFAEMIPDGPEGEYFKELGNPKGLNHTTADNYDLRYELYPGAADQLLLGVFYKNIKDPIEYSAVKTGVTSLSLIPNNFGNATNYGFEAVFTKYFGVFGISANYTYTQSKITTNKLYSFRDAAGIITSRLDAETRPLQGQSNHIGNLSFIYKNPKLGLDIQTAFVYTGARISLVSPYYGLDYWQAPVTQLDFSFEKTFAKKFSFYGKINNLTNSPLQLELHQSYNNYLTYSGARTLALQSDPGNKIIVQKDYFKTSLLFGFRYKF